MSLLMGFDENLITKSILLLKEIENERERQKRKGEETNYKGHNIWSVNVERSLMWRKREEKTIDWVSRVALEISKIEYNKLMNELLIEVL